MKNYLRAVLTLVILTLPPAHRAQGQVFAPGSRLIVAEGSGEIVLVDLNRDGHLDLLTKHLLSRLVEVRLGDGTGFSVAGHRVVFDYQPGAIALGDINGDRVHDLIVARKDDRREYVHVFAGDGSGRFTEVRTSPTNVSAAIQTYKPALFIVDINEDGKSDIVTANGRRNTVEILFGDNLGHFSLERTLTMEAGHDNYSLGIGDVDGDGHLDIATAMSVDATRGRVAVMRGNGKGEFTDMRAPLSVAANPAARALADLNADGHLDIVLTHGRGTTIDVLWNDGKGVFRAAAFSPYQIGAEAFAVVAVDLNNDRKTDLVAATVNSVTVLQNAGDRFAGAPGSPFRSGPGTYHVAVGDVNEDGKLDVAASSFEGDSVTLMLGL
ncbi:MAG TPA: VCBS repeat-containing protein [Vicinamibacterales bacterium]|nr:VCBS repeat-containing protein [Vicinamibacterales bacterium]